MGGNRNDHNTRELDRAELERLAGESVDKVEENTTNEISQSRAQTLQDPLTMALLAEVARNAQTQDFDPADMPTEKSEPVAHPNLKRR
ncbi:MAG: hypothetical protein QM831_39285 [Kofleriaceae bacterium]